jgi:hypothetical protein
MRHRHPIHWSYRPMSRCQTSCHRMMIRRHLIHSSFHQMNYRWIRRSCRRSMNRYLRSRRSSCRRMSHHWTNRRSMRHRHPIHSSFRCWSYCHSNHCRSIHRSYRH